MNALNMIDAIASRNILVPMVIDTVNIELYRDPKVLRLFLSTIPDPNVEPQRYVHDLEARLSLDNFMSTLLFCILPSINYSVALFD
jgi:uncharacterized sodium:solute symporter family permease YidK